MGNNRDEPLSSRTGMSAGGGLLRPGMLFGLLLITAGTLLFVDNLGILPVRIASLFWPVVLLAYSAAAFFPATSLPVKVWSITGMVAGVLLILGKFRIIHATAKIIWPLFLIATGVVLLIYRLRWAAFSERFNAGRVTIGSNREHGSADSRIQEFAVFSSVKRRVEAQGFEGGELTSLFGGIEIDLRWSHMTTASRVAIIEANAAFGAVEIRMPETWKLRMEGTAIFGAYEDKTIPQRPEPGVEPPLLIIRGGTAFGGVTVRN